MHYKYRGDATAACLESKLNSKSLRYAVRPYCAVDWVPPTGSPQDELPLRIVIAVHAYAPESSRGVHDWERGSHVLRISI